MRLIVALCLSLFPVASLASSALPSKSAPSQAPIDREAESYKKLDAFVHDWFDRGHVIGSAIIVVRKGKVTFSKCLGVTKQGGKEPVDLDTVFQIGSISKPFTSSLFAIHPLKEALSLEAEFKPAGFHVAPGTRLKHLLSHTAGFSDFSWNKKIEGGWPRARLMNAVLKTPQAQPGSVFQYSNLLFSMVEEPIAAALKMPYPQAVQEYLLNPLGMKRTTVGLANFMAMKNRAYPHRFLSRDRIEPLKEYSHKYHDVVPSSAGVNSSANDLAKFVLMQLGHGPKVADTATLTYLQQSLVPAPDGKVWLSKAIQGPAESFYGYGWRVMERQGKRIVFHGSWVGGFRNVIAFSPADDIGIVVLNNSESGFAFRTSIAYLADMI